MKYKAIIDTDRFKHFEFFEDGIGKYMVAIDAGATANDEWIPLYFTECKQEQESTLDKIRSEIEELNVLRFSSGERIYKDEVLDIIDKYKAGSEVEVDG